MKNKITYILGTLIILLFFVGVIWKNLIWKNDLLASQTENVDNKTSQEEMEEYLEIYQDISEGKISIDAIPDSFFVQGIMFENGKLREFVTREWFDKWVEAKKGDFQRLGTTSNFKAVYIEPCNEKECYVLIAYATKNAEQEIILKFNFREKGVDKNNIITKEENEFLLVDWNVERPDKIILN